MPFCWRLAWFTIWLPSAASAAECARTLVVAATGLWNGAGSEAAMESRVDREWLDAIARESGICMQYDARETVIARRLALIESGNVDLLVGASKTPERERYAHFTLPYREETVLLFARAERAAQYQTLRQFSDLQALSVPWLAVRDSWLGPEFAAARKALLQRRQISEFDTFGQGVAMLRYGRGELLLAPDTFAQYLAREKIRDVVRLPSVLHREPVYFMLSKVSVSEAELNQINTAIRRLKPRGLWRR